jgi:tape measure domain-containing protein
MAKIGELIVSIVGDNSSLNRALTDSEKQVQGFGTSVANAFGGIAALAGVAAAAIKGIEFNKAAEQAQVSFEVMTGSAQVAADTLQQLRDFANKTPLEFKDIRDATQTMISFGISANDAVKYVKILGDVSGGNADKLKSLSLAFSQIRSTGRLMGQDLLQLINAGFNPLKIISEQTGKTMGELKMEMEKGAISADMVTAAFESATAAGGMFNGMLERQGQTLAGAQSTFSDAFDTFLGGATQGMTKPLVDLFRALSEGLGKVGDNFQNLGDTAGGIISLITKGLKIAFDVIDAIPGPVITFVTALGAVKIAMIAISAAAAPMGLAISSALGPIGIAITAIITGVGMIAAEIDKVEMAKLEKEAADIAKQLGITVDEAKQVKKVMDEVGVSAKEANEGFKGFDAAISSDILDRMMDLVMLGEDLGQSAEVVAKQFGVSASQVLRIAEAQEILGGYTDAEIAAARKLITDREKLASGRKAQIADEKAARDADAKAYLDKVDAEKALAKAQEERSAKAKEARSKELELIRKEIDALLMSEEEKLLAEEARLVSAARSAEEREAIEQVFLGKFREIQEKRVKAAKDADAEIADSKKEETIKKLDAINITTDAELEAYKASVNAAELTEDEKKKLIEQGTEELKKNVAEQKKEFVKLVDYVSGVVSSLSSSLEKIWDANLTTRLQQIEDEKNAALAAAGFLEGTEMQRLIRERDAAIEAGDDVLAAQKQQEIDRQKILDDAARAAAQAEYDAAMNAWTLKQTMAIVDAAVAVIKIWAGDGSVVQKVVDTAATVVVTAAELAVINANKPRAPQLWTGTTNPIRNAGQFIVGDQGPELVTLPQGSTVKNNRDTMEMVQSNGGIMRSTIVVNLDRQTIAQSTVDLINNGQVYLEAI